MRHPRSLVVLVVEDELLIRWALAETLTIHGHKVIEAPDAASGRRVLERGGALVDVILLDLRLPDSDDFGLLADIRRRSPRSAVIMMTTIGAADLRSYALGLGAHALIEKPFDIHAIEPLVRHAHAAAVV
jgi:DNA-binding NtrC family response regulator